MQKQLSLLFLILSLFTILFTFCNKKQETDKDISVRGLADTVGFSQNKQEIEAVINKIKQLSRKEHAPKRGSNKNYIGGICPHDDHLYAGRIYVDLLEDFTMDHIIIFGVAHQARDWGVKGKLIFDDFDFWKGPCGNIKVSYLREKFLSEMDTSLYLISNKFHSEEHSIEGLLPFLQYYNKDIKIVPVLVPYMKWERLDYLAKSFAKTVSEYIEQHNLKLGKDIGVLISTDLVHYGNEGWSGKNYAAFGVDQEGYQKAVSRDRHLIDTYLSGNIKPEKLKELMYTLVYSSDVYTYKITWCGRFSVPFGVDVLYNLKKDLNLGDLNGHFISYGTSLNPGKITIQEPGLGFTAPATLKHWVGYAAVGYE
ncbi:MAG: AmmeMemoRadiSam system protein B [bacterium]